MAYPEDALAPEEQVVLHRHPHWKMLVGPVLALLGTVGLACFLAAALRNQSWAHAGWVVLAVLAAAAVGRLTLLPFLRWATTHFVLTDRRILVRQGLLHRSGLDIPITRINSVRFRHSLTDRLLRTGTLIVESASQEPLEFDDIPQVARVHTLLYHEVLDSDRGPAERDPDREAWPDPAKSER
ncbi:PH domain-containing protein [Rhodococcus sp. X156]|uniref:PH domain-containing protein n=1 Tax=Rhodococcus sp. X156 TaxID=2499145 RepID=UPI000FDC7010|nr:PH domain-containing protein [Rhodococcus sp. X156]